MLGPRPGRVGGSEWSWKLEVFFEPVETKKRAAMGPQGGEAGADEADVDFGGAPGGGVGVRVREVAAERDLNQAS